MKHGCNNLVFRLVIDTVTTMVQGCNNPGNNPGTGLLQPCCNKTMQQNEEKISFSLWLLILLVEPRKGRRKKLSFPSTRNQELIIRRREYPMVKLSPESNVTIQLRFDALTCCVFANIIQASANQVM